jgi:uncharacterized protein (TIGR02996 family)
MMTTTDTFLQAILQDPEDDPLRLVFADWLEEHDDPRAEFIRVQCELARLTEGDPRGLGLQARERQLLADHGRAWVAPLKDFLDWADRMETPCSYTHKPWRFQAGYDKNDGASWRFRRGFIEEVAFFGIEGASRFVTCSDALFERMPVRRLVLYPNYIVDWDNDVAYHTFIGNDSETLRALVSLPCLTRLRALDVPHGNLWDLGVQMLATAPTLAGLKALNLSGNLLGQSDGLKVQALVSSPYLNKLTALDLSDNGIGVAETQALAAARTLAELTALNLSHNPVEIAGVEALANTPVMARLKSLDLGDIQDFDDDGDIGLSTLATSSHLTQLTSLKLNGNYIGVQGIQTLVNSPLWSRLTALHLSGVWSKDSILGTCRIVRCKRFEELLWRPNVGMEGLLALLRIANATALTTLDLSFNELEDAATKALAACPYLTQLTTLDLSFNGLTDASAEALIASPHLQRLIWLDLNGNALSDAAKQALTARFGNGIEWNR